MLKVQESDINVLLKRMHEQFSQMREEYAVDRHLRLVLTSGRYATQLSAIEDAFLKERQALLDANKKEIDDLFEQRRALEMQIIGSKIERDQSG
jgi:hypothetical protein